MNRPPPPLCQRQLNFERLEDTQPNLFRSATPTQNQGRDDDFCDNPFASNAMSPSYKLFQQRYMGCGPDGSNGRVNALAPRRPLYTYEEFRRLNGVGCPKSYAEYLERATTEQQKTAESMTALPPKVGLFEEFRAQSLLPYTKKNGGHCQAAKQQQQPLRFNCSSRYSIPILHDPNNWISVCGLPWQDIDRVLHSCFRVMGNIQQTICHQGTLLLQYQNQAECNRALEFDRKIVCGYKLRVHRANDPFAMSSSMGNYNYANNACQLANECEQYSPRMKPKARPFTGCSPPSRKSLFRRFEETLESFLFEDDG